MEKYKDRAAQHPLVDASTSAIREARPEIQDTDWAGDAVISLEVSPEVFLHVAWECPACGEFREVGLSQEEFETLHAAKLADREARGVDAPILIGCRWDCMGRTFVFAVKEEWVLNNANEDGSESYFVTDIYERPSPLEALLHALTGGVMVVGLVESRPEPGTEAARASKARMN